MQNFKNFDINKIKNKKIILDLDGTFVYDGREEIETEYFLIIENLKKENEIFLLSNGHVERTINISEKLNVKYINTKHQKPNKKALDTLENFNKENTVVIGDKFLTDGLLALQFNLPFYHVKSLTHTNENLQTKIVYFIDDLFGNIFEFLKLIRPKQWVKNFLVFAPIFFAGEFFNLNILSEAFLAFIAFSLSSSLVYIINDYADMENDQLHPKKKYRPLAIGNISKKYLYLFSGILFFALIFILYKFTIILPLLFIYIFLNLLYTFKFKTVPVYDIVLIATMYLLRAIVGGVATGIVISPWLTICVFFAALFIISAKRFGEFENVARKVLRYYSKESLLGILISSATLTLTSYTIYTIIATKSEYAIYTSIIVTAIFFIILNDILFGHKRIESPEIYLLTNRKILFLILIWFIFEFFIIY